jgi:hypothetical protein
MENPRQPLISCLQNGNLESTSCKYSPFTKFKVSKASEYLGVLLSYFSPHQNLWILFLTWFSQIFASPKHLKAFRKLTWFGWRVKYAFTNWCLKNQRPEKDWTNFTRQESTQWFSKEWHCSWQPGWYDSCGKIQREIMCNQFTVHIHIVFACTPCMWC